MKYCKGLYEIFIKHPNFLMLRQSLIKPTIKWDFYLYDICFVFCVMFVIKSNTMSCSVLLLTAANFEIFRFFVKTMCSNLKKRNFVFKHDIFEQLNDCLFLFCCLSLARLKQKLFICNGVSLNNS